MLDIVAPKIRRGGKKRKIRLDGIRKRTGSVLLKNFVDSLFPIVGGIVMDNINPIASTKKAKNTNLRKVYTQEKYIEYKYLPQTYYEITPEALKIIVKNLFRNIIVFLCIYLSFI